MPRGRAKTMTTRQGTTGSEPEEDPQVQEEREDPPVEPNENDPEQGHDGGGDDGDDPDPNDPSDDDTTSDEESSEESEDEEPNDGLEPHERAGRRRGAANPAQQRMSRVLDFDRKRDITIYRQATEKLSEEPFDLTSEQFFDFMNALRIRSSMIGWDDEETGILMVPNEEGRKINILESYGNISLRAIKRHERRYLGNGSRASQDTSMLYECIMRSLSLAGQGKVMLHVKEFQMGRKHLPSGLALLKIVVRESYLDSNATTSMIRQQLAELHTFIPTVDYDISKFNSHVKLLLQSLSARGERTLDLLTYLFKAYTVCRDQDFVKYINDLQTNNDMGTEEYSP